ncbi:MAG: type II toxin-antitoxin system ParD family antitoxin [Alphaproteobacteria bacterium]|nr:type II toxin-antitoxin system ParD family antitoxin [Alphaproteobacteria bacterium]
MTTNVSLPPALERFARKCVKSGRYSNVSEVVRSALRLLQETEARREQFEKTLTDAEAEADRDGTFTADEVAAEFDRILDRDRR